MMILAFRGGRNNPVTTGKLLDRRPHDEEPADGDRAAAPGRGDQGDVERLRARDLGQRAGASDEVCRDLKERVAVVCTKVEGLEKTSDSTAEGVKRIEGYFLQKGIDGR
jgi:hypothetical protein